MMYYVVAASYWSASELLVHSVWAIERCLLKSAVVAECGLAGSRDVVVSFPASLTLIVRSRHSG